MTGWWSKERPNGRVTPATLDAGYEAELNRLLFAAFAHGVSLCRLGQVGNRPGKFSKPLTENWASLPE
jgi:hypothetical protein